MAAAQLPIDQLFAVAAGYRQAGDFRSADVLYASVLAQDPRNADAWHLRGVVAHQLGDTATAVACVEQAVGIAPQRAVFWSNLGLFYQAAGRLDDAVSCLHQSISLEPRLVQARSNLANVLNEKGQFAAAEAECHAALAMQPDLAPAHNNLGVALTGQDRSEEAIACFRRAIELVPELVDAHRNLAHALAEQALFDQARREYETVLALNPRETRALLGLSLIKRHTANDREAFARLETRLRDPLLSVRERAELNFALGKICDDCGLYDQAFEHFRLANEAVRPAWDRQACAQQVEAMIDAFQPRRIALSPNAGHPSQQPVFIVGMPRSGTTLVEQILAAVPHVAACGEVADVQQMALELEAQASATAPWPYCLLEFDDAKARQLADRYLTARLARHPDAIRITDKMPTNFFHLGLTWRLFPRARVIHCQRDPRDACLSCYFTHFASPMEFAYDLDDLGAFYRLYQRMMGHWQRVLPLPILTVRYEQLVADPETESRRLVEFCGLEWDERCRRYHENRNSVRSASGWQVRQPIYRSSVGRWRNYEGFLSSFCASAGWCNAAPLTRLRQ